MKRILVAGATGYLGNFVAREFKSQGYFVRALARSPQKLRDIDPRPDEIVQGEVTHPETLEHACDGIDAVFSSIGITRQKDKLTFQDVDYQGNKNLLEVALRAKVDKFIYVSVLNGPHLRYLDIVRAHEDFVDELKASGMDHTVVRPTGYFSDMEEFFKMAKKGRVWLVGRGHYRMNPIHGSDLARACVAALETRRQEINVGGPEVMTYREIAGLAFKSIGHTAQVSSIPVWLANTATAAVKLFNRHQGGLLAFFTTAMTNDTVAPATGTHTLGAYFQELANDQEFGPKRGWPFQMLSQQESKAVLPLNLKTFTGRERK